jgi:hypothetical protein
MRLKELGVEFEERPKQLQPALKLFDELTGLTDRIKILPARTGDGSVFSNCEELEKMVDRWSSAKDSADSERQIKGIKLQCTASLNVIGNASQQGPLYGHYIGRELSGRHLACPYACAKRSLVRRRGQSNGGQLCVYTISLATATSDAKASVGLAGMTLNRQSGDRRGRACPDWQEQTADTGLRTPTPLSTHR